MAIGLISDDDFDRELSRKIEPRVTIETIEKPGRSEGDNNVPDSLRQIIGEEAVINGRSSALGLAGMFGISPSSVSAYAKGATSTASYDSPSKSIISHINKSRRRAISKAQKTLNASLGAITQDKLDYSDAKDLSTIAKDMSVIIKNLEPPAPAAGDGVPGQQFVIFAPTFRDERTFESIVVSE